MTIEELEKSINAINNSCATGEDYTRMYDAAKGYLQHLKHESHLANKLDNILKEEVDE